MCSCNRSTGETGGSLGLAGRTAYFTYSCERPCLKRKEKERKEGRKGERRKKGGKEEIEVEDACSLSSTHMCTHVAVRADRFVVL